MLKKISVICLTGFLSACGGGDFSPSDSDTSDDSNIVAPDSVAGTSFRHEVQSGSGLYAVRGTYVAAIAASGNTYVVSGDGVNVADSAGTYTYSREDNIGDVTYIDSIISTGAVCEYTFTAENSGSYSCTASGSNQEGTFTIF